MKWTKRLFFLGALAFGLSGCAQLGEITNPAGRSIVQGGLSVTAPVQISTKQAYSYEVVYNGAQKLYLEYLRLPHCGASSSSAISGIGLCRDQRTVTVLSKVRKQLVVPAVAKARQAQMRGDVNALSIMNEAKNIILDWRGSIPLEVR